MRLLRAGSTGEEPPGTKWHAAVADAQRAPPGPPTPPCTLLTVASSSTCVRFFTRFFPILAPNTRIAPHVPSFVTRSHELLVDAARAGHCSLRPGPGGGPPGPGDPRRRRPVRSRARGQAGGRKGPRRKRARLCEPPEPDQPQGRRTRRRRLSTPPSRARAAALNPPPLSARPAETGQARSYQGRQRGPGSGPLGRVRARHFPTAGPGQSET